MGDIKGDSRSVDYSYSYRAFPKLGVPFSGVPMIKIKEYWVVYWVPFILGNYKKRLKISKHPEAI